LTLEYLKKDQERIDKKLEELNLKLLDLEHKSELKEIENKYDAIKDKEGFNDDIWADIYKDALDLEKKSKVKDLKK
jgi:hypothetical protein